MIDAEEILAEFRRTLDIGMIGWIIWRRARALRIELETFLHPPEETLVNRQVRRLTKDAYLVSRSLRMPSRYPIRSEFVRAMKWVSRKIRIAVLSGITSISRWNLAEELEKVRRRISELRNLGRRAVSLRELVRTREEIIPVFLSLLFLERDGEVELVQRDQREELYVVLEHGKPRDVGGG